MPYAVAADLDLSWSADYVTQLALQADMVTRDGAMVDAACAAASAMIDAYLARRYALPLVLGGEGRAVLRMYAVDLAIHRLASRNATLMTETIGKRYEAAIGFLDKVAENKAAIPLLGQDAPDAAPAAPAGAGAPAAPADPDASPFGSDLRSDPRVFTRDRLRYF